MKILRAIPTFIVLISAVFADIPITGTWLFNIGNDSIWAATDYNDSTWYPIEVPGAWEEQGFANYDGFAWYRIRFQVNTDKIDSDSLYLLLGKTRDAVIPFVNGQAICPMAHSFDSTQTAFFRFPAWLLSEDNTLAVQFNNLSGRGGILSDPVIISPEPPPERVAVPMATPRRSWSEIPFSNGLVVARYNTGTREFSGFFPHVYSQIDPENHVIPLASSARTVLFKNRHEIDMTELSTKAVGYLSGTGIVNHVMTGNDFILEQYAFAPFTINKPYWIFFAVLRSQAADKYSLNFILDDALETLNVGKWSFQEGDCKWLFVVCGYDEPETSQSFNAIRKYKNEYPGFSALIHEINWWRKWQNCSVLPAGISQSEAVLYLQSLAILKMAQCRERFPARGQIVYGFPPDNMAVATIPGMGFSIDAFLKSGHYEEALSALQFIFNGRCGYLKHFGNTGENRGIGQDYSISGNYYYSDGTEAVETDEYGPIIYLGNFGVALWNLKQYVEATNDTRFLEYYWQKISTEVADVIVKNIDDTGLVRADRGFFNGGAPKHYFFTSVCAYRGLVDAVWMARMVNDEAHAKDYEAAAVSLRMQIEAAFFNEDQNSIKSFLEGDETAVDAATALGLLWVFTPQDYISKGTLSTFEKSLATGNGFQRFPGKRKDVMGEWVFGDILIAALNQYMTNFDEANSLRSWIVGQALYNYGLIPEYYSENSHYAGTVPLCGLGAGVYVSSYWGE